jgi:iron complex outermembrane receptor protein
MGKRAFFQFSAFVGVALLGANGARAQTAGSAPQPQASSSTLSEVIVTAQHRSQRLEEVPISVTAISGKDMEKSGVQSLRDLQSVAPSFLVSNDGDFTQLAIRGVTSSNIGPGLENNVTVYVDGFYDPDSSSIGSDFANVSDVQVLKGPQGTLYGRNATGGVLLVNTLEPSETRPIIQAEAGYGNLNDRRVRAYVGIPLGHGLAIGIGAFYHANDGWIKNSVTGADANKMSDTEIRLKIKYEPTSELQFVLGENYFYKSDPTAQAVTLIKYASNGGYKFPPGTTALWSSFPGADLTTQSDRISTVNNPIFKVVENETTLRARWNSPFGTFTSHTSYTDEKPFFAEQFDGTQYNFQYIPANFTRHTFNEQLDYDYKPFSALEILAGASYFHDLSSDNVAVYINGFPGPFVPPPAPYTSIAPLERTSASETTKAYAGYVDVTWEPIDHLFLNGGVRYSNDERSVYAYYAYTAFGVPPQTPFAPRVSTSFPSTTPRATIRYEFAPRSDIYFSYSQGFKSGAYNSLGQNQRALDTPVQPEHITAYEVGLKMARGIFRFETAAYYYDYRNLQVSIVGPGNPVVVLLTNAATATNYGYEATLNAAVTHDLNLHASFAYTHARYGSYKGANVCLPTPISPGSTTLVENCNSATDPTHTLPLTEDFSGKRIARAPDWTANIGGDYTIPLSVGSVVISASAYYTSPYAPFAEAYNPLTGQPYYYDKSYTLVNAAANWIRGPYTIGVYANNIGNTRYAIINEATASGQQQVLNQPRTYGFRVSYTY